MVLLNGKPGDAIVSFHHTNSQPPRLARSKSSTTTTPADPRPGTVSTLSNSPSSLVGLTAVAAAMAIFETDQPTANEKDKARRRLDKLTGHGFLKITQQGDAATNKPKIWAAK